MDGYDTDDDKRHVTAQGVFKEDSKGWWEAIAQRRAFVLKELEQQLAAANARIVELERENENKHHVDELLFAANADKQALESAGITLRNCLEEEHAKLDRLLAIVHEVLNPKNAMYAAGHDAASLLFDYLKNECVKAGFAPAETKQ